MIIFDKNVAYQTVDPKRNTRLQTPLLNTCALTTGSCWEALSIRCFIGKMKSGIPVTNGKKVATVKAWKQVTINVKEYISKVS